jgi:endonuclease III
MTKIPEIISPYSLLQEELWKERNPYWKWRILTVCIMLNLSTAKQVRKVTSEFFDSFPGPFSASDESQVSKMTEILRPIGMQNRKSRSIMLMSRGFILGKQIQDLHGAGKYAHDSWKIFVERRLIPDVKDKELKNYVRWVQSLTE